MIEATLQNFAQRWTIKLTIPVNSVTLLPIIRASPKTEELVLETTEKIVGWSNILPNQFDFSAIFFQR